MNRELTNKKGVQVIGIFHPEVMVSLSSPRRNTRVADRPQLEGGDVPETKKENTLRMNCNSSAALLRPRK